MAAVTMPHVMRMRFYLHEITALFEIRHDPLSRLVSIQPRIRERPFVHRSVVVHHANDFEGMSLSDLEVVGVVRGRDFHAARSEIHIHVLVRHHGNLSVRQRQEQRLADQMRIPFIRGVDGYRRIAQHGFGASGGDDDFPAAVRRGIADMPKRSCFLGVLHLRVRKRRLTAGTPIDNSVPAINQALIVKVDERLPHRAGALFVHRERLSRPIAGRAHSALLERDAPAVLLRPLPRALQKALSAHVGLGEPILLHLLHDLDLRRNRSVVVARKPQRRIALHALEAYERILHRRVHRMPHVQLPRDIGRRHHDRKGHFVGVRFRAEISGFFPFGINPVLEVLGVVRLLHLHSLSFSLSAIPRLRVGGHGIPVFLYFVYFFIISLSAEIVNY